MSSLVVSGSVVRPSAAGVAVGGAAGGAASGRATRRPAASGAGRPAALRLTRRGRFVVKVAVLVVFAVVVLAAVLLGGGRASAGGEGGSAAVVTYRVVMPGETLWAIAREIAPAADPRDVVADIVELNDLPTSGVSAGARIAVPVYA